jgi:hypothetical protein
MKWNTATIGKWNTATIGKWNTATIGNGQNSYLLGTAACSITATAGFIGGVPEYDILVTDYGTGSGTSGDPWTGSISGAVAAASPSDVIYCPAGYYQLSGNIDIGKSLSIIGAGRGETIIKTANASGFTIYAPNVTVKKLTMDGAAQTSGDKPVLNLHPYGGQYPHYFLGENLEVKNCITCGIQNRDANYGVYRDIHVHHNGKNGTSHGMHPCADTSGYNRYNTYEYIYGWNNAGSTIDDRGSSSSVMSLSNTYDHIYSENDGGHGFAFTYVDDLEVTNMFVDGAGVAGVYCREVINSAFTNATIDGSGDSGVFITYDCDNITLTNITTTLSTDYGIWIYNDASVGDIYVDDCSFDSISDDGNKIIEL